MRDVGIRVMVSVPIGEPSPRIAGAAQGKGVTRKPMTDILCPAPKVRLRCAKKSGESGGSSAEMLTSSSFEQPHRPSRSPRSPRRPPRSQSPSRTPRPRPLQQGTQRYSRLSPIHACSDSSSSSMVPRQETTKTTKPQAQSRRYRS